MRVWALLLLLKRIGTKRYGRHAQLEFVSTITRDP